MSNFVTLQILVLYLYLQSQSFSGNKLLPSILCSVEFMIQRAEKFGGTVSFTSYEQLEQAYAKEEVFPLDLKNAVAAELNKVLF